MCNVGFNYCTKATSDIREEIPLIMPHNTLNLKNILISIIVQKVCFLDKISPKNHRK